MPACFTSWFTATSGSCIATCGGTLGDAEMAEDAFQAAFLQVHLKCHQYEPGRAFRPWLYTIATNQAIDAQRRSRRHRMVSLDRSSPKDGEDVGKLLDLLTSKEPTPPRSSTRPSGRLGCTRRSSNCPTDCEMSCTLFTSRN